MIDKLKHLIESSGSVLITSHLGADPDAVCSSLLLKNTLVQNFPDKKINVVIEEVSYGLDFIEGFSSIKISSLSSAIDGYKPALVIIVDAHNIARCTREPETVRQLEHKFKLAIVDHHEPDDKDEAAVYINQNSPAVTQDIYDICFNKLHLEKPKGYADLTMTGIYSDTGGFKYLSGDHKLTLKIVSDLVDAGVNIERISNSLSRITSDAIEVLSLFINNSAEYKKFNYTYLDDATVETVSYPAIKQAADTFMHNYLRNIGKKTSGFLVYKDANGEPDDYKVSFRSTPGEIDVAAIAKKLGGGGHKPAAGAQIKAKNVEDAISKIKKVISDN